jgi:hypothetical protein
MILVAIDTEIKIKMTDAQKLKVSVESKVASGYLSNTYKP